MVSAEAGCTLAATRPSILTPAARAGSQVSEPRPGGLLSTGQCGGAGNKPSQRDPSQRPQRSQLQPLSKPPVWLLRPLGPHAYRSPWHCRSRVLRHLRTHWLAPPAKSVPLLSALLSHTGG